MPPESPFEAMRRRAPEPVDNPGYLQYWEQRAGRGIERDDRIARIVKGLTHVALRGMEGDAEYTDRVPALQARYWYRTLGPLNPMTDIESDLITAAEMMYDQDTPHPAETANLRMDSVYALTDLVRVADTPQNRRSALQLASGIIRYIRQRPRYQPEASHKLQSAIAEGDIWHDALRAVHTGTTRPTPLTGQTDKYRTFQGHFAARELKNIAEFEQMVDEGITDQNFGLLFEWYLIAARRHRTWVDGVIDTVAVRGTTSRENAEWTGEYEPDPSRQTANHDIVVSTYKTPGVEEKSRLQLKAVKSPHQQYHPAITVLDYFDVFGEPFRSIDSATAQLKSRLALAKRDYTA